MLFRAFHLRGLVALLSIVLAGSVLGLTIGLWERSSLVLKELLSTIGRSTWLVEMAMEAGVQPPPLPDEGPALEALRELPGVQGLALSTGTTRMLSGFNYALIGVNDAYFEVRRYALREGRPFAGPSEAVVGSDLAHLLGQRVEAGIQSRPYRVVGVLESVAERGWLDAAADGALFVPLEDYFGPYAGPSRLYLDVLPEHFRETGGALRRWLESQGIEGYQVAPLADRYGVQLRERVARLLGGALGFGLVAALLTAGANLAAFYLARAFSRVRQTGMRRALGATRAEIVWEELMGVLPWAVAGLMLALPLVYVGSAWLQGVTELAAQPGPLALALLTLGLVVLVLVAALGPALWGASQPPVHALRGLASSLPQRRLWLAGAGLALGVMGLVLQASTARSAELETERLLGRVGQRVGSYASIIPPGEFGDPRGLVSLTPRDYQAFLDSPSAAFFSRTAFVRTFTLTRLDGPSGESVTSVRAYEGPFPEIAGAELLLGRWPARDAEEIVLGDMLAEELFGGIDPVGETVDVFGRDWRVVGVFESGTQGIPGGISNSQALLPGALIRAPGFGSVIVEVAPGLDVDESLLAGADFFTARYPSADLMPFRPWRPVDLTPPIRQTLETLAAVYRVLAVSLLLLGGAGLAAQMLVSLSLRVREIGIRRALGATRASVFRQFLGEGLLLALLAGLAGVLLGVGASYLAARLQEVRLALDWPWMAAALTIGLAVAALFGALPARSAALIPPARAMREHT